MSTLQLKNILKERLLAEFNFKLQALELQATEFRATEDYLRGRLSKVESRLIKATAEAEHYKSMYHKLRKHMSDQQSSMMSEELFEMPSYALDTFTSKQKARKQVRDVPKSRTRVSLIDQGNQADRHRMLGLNKHRTFMAIDPTTPKKKTPSKAEVYDRASRQLLSPVYFEEVHKRLQEMKHSRRMSMLDDMNDERTLDREELQALEMLTDEIWEEVEIPSKFMSPTSLTAAVRRAKELGLD
ncbi:hypothetical protein PCE1_004133 [Barthelona sp. PCE]